MRERTITLTIKEIILLENTLSQFSCELREKIRTIDNESGCNTSYIKMLKEMEEECDNLWVKLYKEEMNI